MPSNRLSGVSLDILVRGWELPGWSGAFYPDDLPPDWRLTFFANEFPALLVPADRWGEAGEDLLRDWSQDVPDGFRVYLEAPRVRVDAGDLRCVERLLGGRLAGLVADAAMLGLVPAGPVPRFGLRDAIGTALPDACGIALRVPGGEIRDLRAARARLEALAEAVRDGRGLLLLDGAVPAEDLRRWWSLAWLLGVA